MVFLRGVLDIKVIEGKDLPDLDTSWFTTEKDVSDPYVTVDSCVGGKSTKRIVKTTVIDNDLNPKWNEKFHIEMSQETETFLFTVKDKDLIGASHMGEMNIQAEDLLSEKPINGFFSVKDIKGNPAGSLKISIHYRSSVAIRRMSFANAALIANAALTFSPKKTVEPALESVGPALESVATALESVKLESVAPVLESVVPAFASAEPELGSVSPLFDEDLLKSFKPADDAGPKKTLLRGHLHATLHEAIDLPDVDAAFFNIIAKDKSDPFAQVRIGANVLCKTYYVNNDLTPNWQESFKVPVCHQSDEIHIEVFDKDHFKEGLLGELSLRTEDLLNGEKIEGWYPLAGCDGHIRISLKFVPKDDLKHIFEVPDCYFPLREGCQLKLYQDAHCPALPIYENVPSYTEDVYDAPCAWQDLSHDINNAQKFIYMTGWSVWAECKLKRQACDAECDESDGPVETIGELLKRKARAGVRVLVMVWDEKTSTGVLPGLMGTHDEDTAAYFEGSEVEFAKVPRVRLTDGITSFIENQFAQTCYSHHQKTLIMDVPAAEGVKAQPILAYVGGLDVTDGRWDTPDHKLYSSLLDYHKEDFYQKCVTTTPEVGPREPWHDVHARVKGPVAKDILDNFVERWRLQVHERESRLLTMGDEFDFSASVEVKEANRWNAQLFRSITSDSATFDFDRIQYVPMRKSKNVDDSIHRAYIHQIRQADRFMFFENQYFLGSAYSWEDERDTKAHHIIPQEITRRICEKISAGEHIVAYIVIPMYPEGDPASRAVQEILHWQHRTMEMMYKEIATTIKENKLKTKPTDYLAFFCLGKGEVSDDIPKQLQLPEPNTPAANLREKARFMIYVHSKMMIIDDDYIIVGSANINQRSMSGTRDTEIAVGAFQPMHTREVSGDPRGSVHQFRMALWAEHLDGVEEVHANPGTLKCVQAVNEQATTNWKNFIADEPVKIKGHLLQYPVTVRHDGSVAALKDFPNFPDTEAPILGAPTFLPNKLTT